MTYFFRHKISITYPKTTVYVTITTMDKRKMTQPNIGWGVVDELKKVSWPTRSETIRLTLVVIIISLIIGLYVGIIDILLAKALEFITRFR